MGVHDRAENTFSVRLPIATSRTPPHPPNAPKNSTASHGDALPVPRLESGDTAPRPGAPRQVNHNPPSPIEMNSIGNRAMALVPGLLRFSRASAGFDGST